MSPPIPEPECIVPGRTAVAAWTVPKLPVTVLIAAKNEERNIGRCLAALQPAKRVILLDSASADKTAAMAQAAGAEVIQFHYQGGYPKKRQWALEHLNLDSPWLLLLDADEVVPDALWMEIEQVLQLAHGPNAYLVTKGFHFLGRRFRFGGFSHSAVTLFKSGTARFERLNADAAGGLDMEVHERVIVEGPIGRLKTPLIHQDFKGLEAYLDRHNHYSTWEATVRFHFLKTGWFGDETIKPGLWGNSQERRRFLKSLIMRMPGEPWLWFAYHFLLRLGFLEGRRGLIASQIRAQYIANVRAKMFELQEI